MKLEKLGEDIGQPLARRAPLRFQPQENNERG